MKTFDYIYPANWQMKPLGLTCDRREAHKVSTASILPLYSNLHRIMLTSRTERFLVIFKYVFVESTNSYGRWKPGRISEVEKLCRTSKFPQ